MKKLLPSLVVLIILFTFQFDITNAGRGCCSWHGGQDYCDSNTGRWVCNDGTYSPTCTCSTYSSPSYNYTAPTVDYYIPPVQTYIPPMEPVKIIPNCNKKYPGTIYQEETDMCICGNGNDYNKVAKSCETMNQMCHRKYPGTSYRKSDDMCVCGNGTEFNEKENKCLPIPKTYCYYSDNSRAEVGEISAQKSICTKKGTWECQVYYSVDKRTGHCISPGDVRCQNAYGVYSVWTNQYDSNSNLICGCSAGYEMIGSKCVQKQ